MGMPSCYTAGSPYPLQSSSDPRTPAKGACSRACAWSHLSHTWHYKETNQTTHSSFRSLQETVSTELLDFFVPWKYLFGNIFTIISLKIMVFLSYFPHCSNGVYQIYVFSMIASFCNLCCCTVFLYSRTYEMWLNLGYSRSKVLYQCEF